MLQIIGAMKIRFLQALAKLRQEDLTIAAENDTENNQMLLKGVGRTTPWYNRESSFAWIQGSYHTC